MNVKLKVRNFHELVNNFWKPYLRKQAIFF